VRRRYPPRAARPSIVPRRAIYYARLLIYDSRRGDRRTDRRALSPRALSRSRRHIWTDESRGDSANWPKHAGGGSRLR